ncbi:LPXTG cell wall anchor domain-containing protein [Longispora albida]|nr:LPXTG cell wall anchor domain-containing protein [Longispora albida]
MYGNPFVSLPVTGLASISIAFVALGLIFAGLLLFRLGRTRRAANGGRD